MSTTSQPDTGTVLRRQKDGSRIPVPCPLSIIDTITSWVELTGVTRFKTIIAAKPNAENFISIYFIFCITNTYILQKGYCGSVPFKTI